MRSQRQVVKDCQHRKLDFFKIVKIDWHLGNKMNWLLFFEQICIYWHAVWYYQNWITLWNLIMLPCSVNIIQMSVRFEVSIWIKCLYAQQHWMKQNKKGKKSTPTIYGYTGGGWQAAKSCRIILMCMYWYNCFHRRWRTMSISQFYPIK